MPWNNSHYLNNWILLNRNIPMNLLSSWFISSVVQSCPTVCDPVDCSMPGFPVHHQLPELAQTHVHRVGDAIQPSHPLSSPSLPTFNLSQYQGLFQWVSSLHTVVYNNLDSKCDFAPPTILLRLLLCSWTRVSFLVGSNILLCCSAASCNFGVLAEVKLTNFYSPICVSEGLFSPVSVITFAWL